MRALEQDVINERNTAEFEVGLVRQISLACSPPVFDERVLLIKRWVDLVVGSVTLLAVLPLGIVIAVLVKFTSRGPVFFVQERVGKGGMPFRVIKFRTMRDGTHKEVLGDEVQRRRYESNDFKLPPDDPRITLIGRILRKSSLDELPQLINVLRGEMSLVGIRPLLVAEVARRSAYDQACYEVLPPGMTGLWQVEGRSTIGDHDRVALDRQYVEEWSCTNDLRLLALTPLAVLCLHRAH